MTSTTPSPTDRRRRGMTLVEVMVSVVLSSMILSGVLSTTLMIGRAGLAVRNYADMTAQARKGLEQFAQDTRQASEIVWNSASSVTLTVDSTSVTYAYSSTLGTFTRTIGTASTTLISGVSSFQFIGYTITGVDVSGANDLSTAAGRTAAAKVTKQMQISLTITRTSVVSASVTNAVLSARYTLRNKRVTA